MLRSRCHRSSLPSLRCTSACVHSTSSCGGSSKSIRLATLSGPRRRFSHVSRASQERAISKNSSASSGMPSDWRASEGLAKSLMAGSPMSVGCAARRARPRSLLRPALGDIPARWPTSACCRVALPLVGCGARLELCGGVALLHLLHVSHHRVAHDLQLLGRTELKVLGARLGAGRNVPCLDVESVSGLEYLLVVTAVERETPLDHIPPVRARALVIRQSLEQRGGVHVLSHRQEVGCGVREILSALFHGTVVLDVRRACARALRHRRSSFGVVRA